MAEQDFNEKIGKIEQVDKVGGSSALTADVLAAEEIASPEKIKFDDAVAKAESRWIEKQQVAAIPTDTTVAGVSPIHELSQAQGKIEPIKKPPTIDQIVQQSEDLRGTIQSNVEKIKEVQKANPDIRVNASEQAVLTNKLIHVDSGLRTALSKTGVEVTAKDFVAPTEQKPLVKFLGMLSNSDRQLSAIVGQVEGLQANGQLLRPETLLAVQIKLNFVQQQLEFFTNVINKVVEGTKTVFNVQI
jgi:hypothetical protein